jgi:hypothetical protein
VIRRHGDKADWPVERGGNFGSVHGRKWTAAKSVSLFRIRTVRFANRKTSLIGLRDHGIRFPLVAICPSPGDGPGGRRSARGGSGGTEFPERADETFGEIQPALEAGQGPRGAGRDAVCRKRRDARLCKTVAGINPRPSVLLFTRRPCVGARTPG